MGPKKIVFPHLFPGVMSSGHGLFPHYVRVTDLEFSCEQEKLLKKMFPLETQDIHGMLTSPSGAERRGTGSAVGLQLWGEF